MKATASMCTPRTVRGTHTFKIAGYSLHRGLGAGRYVRSATFDVGGYLWRIEYYPDAEMEMKNGDYASVSLELVTTDAQARAFFEVRLVDQANKLPPSVVLARKKPLVFRSNPPTYMSEDFLQPLAYLQNDSLVVECDITVMKESELAPIATTFDIQSCCRRREVLQLITESFGVEVIDRVGEITHDEDGVDVLPMAHALCSSCYSLHMGHGIGKSLQSAAFDVGGYRIKYCPDVGLERENGDNAFVFLEFTNDDAEARALLEFR
ncbi:hypothetical protein ACQ4PT_018359 [Festuca glaucescens]